MSKGLSGDAMRFIIAGGLNTALTSGIYFVLVLMVSPEIAYTISWIAGLTFVVLIYPDRVFVGGRKSWTDRLMLGATTIGVFALGLIVLRTLTMLGNTPQIAFILTLFCTTLANFLLGRFVLRRPTNTDESAPLT